MMQLKTISHQQTHIAKDLIFTIGFSIAVPNPKLNSGVKLIPQRLFHHNIKLLRIIIKIAMPCMLVKRVTHGVIYFCCRF